MEFRKMPPHLKCAYAHLQAVLGVFRMNKHVKETLANEGRPRLLVSASEVENQPYYHNQLEAADFAMRKDRKGYLTHIKNAGLMAFDRDWREKDNQQKRVRKKSSR